MQMVAESLLRHFRIALQSSRSSEVSERYTQHVKTERSQVY